MGASVWQYRVLENDDDGDPLDHGVVRARNRNDVRRLLKERLTDLFGDEDGEDSVTYLIRLYPLLDTGVRGIVPTGDHVDISIPIRSDC